MLLSTNLHKFHGAFGLTKTIDILAEAGFQGVDFNTDLEEYHTDAHSPEFYQQIREYANDKGIGFYQTHAPFLTGFPDMAVREQHFDKVVKGLYHSSLLGAQMVTVHPCKFLDANGVWDNNAIMEYNLNYYKRLIPYAEEYGVKIAIENIHSHITKTPEVLMELLDVLDNDVFTICYDVGHDQIAGNDPAETIRAIGHKIGCTHIHDNNGVHDLHTLPYYGVIDWEKVAKAFAQSGYTGNLNYEAAGFVSKVPAELLTEGAKYMASVGKYLIGRFHHYQSFA